MNCTHCKKEYSTIEFEGIEIQYCKGSGLFWFSQGQLSRIDIKSDSFGEFLKELGKPNEEVHPDENKTCPECLSVFHSHSYLGAPHVKVRDCYSCGGLSLSYTQIIDIRENSMTTAQLEAYTEQVSHSVSGYTQMENQRLRRGGLGGFAKTWTKLRFWSKNE